MHRTRERLAKPAERKTTTIYYLWLLPLGLLIGAFGTLIGTGGGFILVPILLLVYPSEKTELITAISLAVFAILALTGTLTHIAQAVFVPVIWRTTVLTIAVLIGAQAGAGLSNRVGGKMISAASLLFSFSLAFVSFWRNIEKSTVRNLVETYALTAPAAMI